MKCDLLNKIIVLALAITCCSCSKQITEYVPIEMNPYINNTVLIDYPEGFWGDESSLSVIFNGFRSVTPEFSYEVSDEGSRYINLKVPIPDIKSGSWMNEEHTYGEWTSTLTFFSCKQTLELSFLFAATSPGPNYFGATNITIKSVTLNRSTIERLEHGSFKFNISDLIK